MNKKKRNQKMRDVNKILAGKQLKNTLPSEEINPYTEAYLFHRISEISKIFQRAIV